MLFSLTVPFIFLIFAEEGVFIRVWQTCEGGGDIPGLDLGKGRIKGPESRNPALPASTSNTCPIPGPFLQPLLIWNTEPQELTSRQSHSLSGV